PSFSCAFTCFWKWGISSMQGIQNVAQKFTTRGVLLSLITFSRSVIFTLFTSCAMPMVTISSNPKNNTICFIRSLFRFFHLPTRSSSVHLPFHFPVSSNHNDRRDAFAVAPHTDSPHRLH